ncbi:MAG: hypothetical protein J6D03_06310 [Clostridia bacterium]|nr:hypothetical protein [Clostridia bacterium]HBC84991.1 hypothetical protein [Clostridiales bacterium]
MEENLFKVGDLCKHFKGKSLLEKNIYKIIATNVTYSGDKLEEPLNNLVVYENIFQNGKTFTREYKDLVEELSEEKKNTYNQIYRVEKLTEEEIKLVNSEEFKKEKMKLK